MQIYGKGLYVDHWNHQWLTGSGTNRCTFPVWWWANFTESITGPDICGNGTFEAWWTLRTRMAAGKACNTWLGSKLEPCESIHP
jgi:hypothetical protein